jgi:hypothetical protein
MCRLAELGPAATRSHRTRRWRPIRRRRRTWRSERATSFSVSVVSGGFLSELTISKAKKEGKNHQTAERKKKKKVRRAREATAGREDKAFFGKASWPITVVQDCPTELGAVVKDHDQTKRRRTFITTNNLLAADPGGHDGPQASPEGDTTVCGQPQHQPSPAQGHGLNPARPDGANSLLLRFSSQ